MATNCPLAQVDGEGPPVTVPVRPPVEESWPEAMARLRRELDLLEGMLEHLEARPPARPRRNRERALKRWLRGAIDWIEAVLELGPPQSDDEAEDVVFELYLFDLERPRAVDAFHALIEEAGEGFEA